MMGSALPHNAQIRADVSSYLVDARQIIEKSAKSLTSSSEFRHIYKLCLATDSVFHKLTSSRAAPRLTVARGLIQRVPLLIACGQVPASYNELRRLIEVVLWCVYFT